MHRLLRELLALVPPQGQPWPAPARARWLAAFAAVAELVYEDGPPGEPVPSYVEGAPPEQRHTVDLREEPAPTGRRARHRRSGS